VKESGGERLKAGDARFKGMQKAQGQSERKGYADQVVACTRKKIESPDGWPWPLWL